MPLPLAPSYRVILLGSDEIALTAFTVVRSLPGVEIVGVYSQPDRPSGRGQEVKSNPVASWARIEGLALFQPEKLTPEHAQELGRMKIDLGVVMAYGQILKDDFLAATHLGFINFHGSILPALRGATPVEGALASGLQVTGISLQQVVRRLDAGPLHAAAELKIAKGEGRTALRTRLGQLAGELAQSALPGILSGASRPVAQDESKVSYTRRLTREDAALDFNASASELVARIHALEGWPGSAFIHAGLTIKVGAASAGETGAVSSPGTILAADRDGVTVACRRGVLCMTKLQRPTAKMLPTGEFLAGYPLSVGEVLPSSPMPALVGPIPFSRPPKA
ncbi:MAG: methionyl-tRNA formyltransferase [Verrucomicrobia bacterium]|nr:methionyl-tRNA formyltransferase [Verrucomicrobiota bacterium]